jgi:hypothetical protein
MLILECSQGCDGRTVALLYPFATSLARILTKLGTYLVLMRVWNLLIFKVKGQGHWVNFLPCNILVNTRESINILQWILTKLGTYWPLTLKINRVPDSPKDYVWTKFGQYPLEDVDSGVFTRMLRGKNLNRWHWPLTYDLENQCEHSRINILQWILTKLGTYLDLKRIWNPIDFQGQRSTSQGLIFRRGDMRYNFNKGNTKRGISPRLKIRPCDVDLWPWKSIGFQILLRSKYVPSLVKIRGYATFCVALVKIISPLLLLTFVIIVFCVLAYHAMHNGKILKLIINSHKFT